MSSIDRVWLALLVVGLIVVAVSYAVILAAARRDRREMGWTVIAALILLALIAFTLRQIDWRLTP